MGEDMKAYPEGRIFHVVTYGKGAMGSYASQLTTKQRWMVTAYIRSKIGGGAASIDTSKAATGAGVSQANAGADSAGARKN